MPFVNDAIKIFSKEESRDHNFRQTKGHIETISNLINKINRNGQNKEYVEGLSKQIDALALEI